MFGAALIAGASLALAAAGDVAAPAPATPPVEAFFAKPAINGMRLSPSGRYLASIQKRGEGQAVVVYDRQTATEQVATYAGSSHIGFDWIEWKGDDRLLLRAWLFETLRANNKPDGPVIGFRYGRYVEALDRDGKHLTVMFAKNPNAVQRYAPFLSFLDLLPDDPDHVLVAAPDAQGFSSVWKVDVHSGEGQLVQDGDASTVGWGVDGEGQVVERTEVADGRLSFQAHGAGDGWTEIANSARKGPGELADFEVLGPAPGAGKAYVAAHRGEGEAADKRAVYVYDFTARAFGPRVGPPAGYDVASIVYRQGSRELAGICHVADVFGCDFLDPRSEVKARALSRYFHDRRNIAPVSISADDRLWVLSLTGADLAGAYYLFDSDRKDVALVGERYPGLPEASLGKAERYDYKARDGTDIPAYLTRPPGAVKGAEDAPPPTVVLVHDGPESRVSLDFDPLTQFLATRGYQVLRPNFRGSGGYGRAWAQAGYGQWGGRMQDDVVDGARDLVARGLADPERLCIVGGGYGGYAALQAAASEDGLFSCVAAWSAPSDLAAQLRFQARSDDGAGFGDSLVRMGDPERDGARLAQASPITHAGEFDAPVLLIHGEEDDVVPVEQARALAKALEAAGKQVELVELKDEGHADFSEAHSRLMFQALADFLAGEIGPRR